jgi:hypothetical protein
MRRLFAAHVKRTGPSPGTASGSERTATRAVPAAKDVDEVRALLSERLLHAVIARAENQLLSHDGNSAAGPALLGGRAGDSGSWPAMSRCS